MNYQTVVCRLLEESAEMPMKELTQAAQEAGNKALGSRWNTREDCPSPTPAGASLQAANQELSRINFDTPEGLIAGLGYALTQPGHAFQFHQASTAEDRSGLAGNHQWSIMLPTSAREAQEVYEPLIGIQYPMLCNVKNGSWQIGTVSIREEGQIATGFRFVNWVHDDPREEARAAPRPEATTAAYRQIETMALDGQRGERQHPRPYHSIVQRTAFAGFFPAVEPASQRRNCGQSCWCHS